MAYANAPYPNLANFFVKLSFKFNFFHQAI
jgi:hypothetical protein